jgi:pyrophosphatase PpaX
LCDVQLTTFLFDLDGTLIDSVELILRSYRHTLRAHRGYEPPDELWLKGLGTPIRVQLRQWTEDPAEIEAMAKTYSVYNLEHHDALVRPYDGIVSAVEKLQAHGKRLALVTSKVRGGAERGLRVAGLTAAFRVIIGADDVRNPKPHPEPVLRAIEQLGSTPAETVFIGDSRHDIESGQAAGVKTAAALWGPFDRAHLEDLEPDYWLDRPQDIALLTPDT